MKTMKIQKVLATEILDSRGTPTVGATVILSDGSVGTANAPSGASTGKFEAHEKRDNDRKRYLGRGVKKAVEGIEETVAPVLENMQRVTVQNVDRMLIELDNTKNKEKLGANATLAVSLAAAKALAAHYKQPFFRYLGGTNAQKLPVPMMNILNGGKHADNTVDFQEFMIMPLGAFSFREGLRMGAEIYHWLKIILKEEGMSTAVGDEGGFAPDLGTARDVLCLIVRAAERAGYKPGEQVGIALDAAASELYEEERGIYVFPGESRIQGEEVARSTAEMIAYYKELTEEFPIVSIEDGLQEDDWEGWKELTRALGQEVQLVGDDLFVTNTKRLKCGIKLGVANAILIKVNQIGTLSEALDAVEMAHKAGYRAVISHRSGETEDAFIADLAVACGAGQIKTGAPCRTDRTAKYNQLLRIEDYLGRPGLYENPFTGVEK
ncbi:phosphopyruvate hydratase [Hominenteromicrobium sp.]|uniref:phosphopyruvate hydratase n=1 Tax=Hominenteromicrobium sp. TaxID=3073581 RepID=UPI003AF19E99